MKTHALTTCATVAIFLLGTSSPALAYSYNTCNGTPITDSNSHIYFEVDETCSIPVGSIQWSAAVHAMGEYDNILPGFMQVAGSSPSGCYYSQGDGISEVATVLPSTIGGNNGITFTEPRFRSAERDEPRGMRSTSAT